MRTVGIRLLRMNICMWLSEILQVNFRYSQTSHYRIKYI